MPLVCGGCEKGVEGNSGVEIGLPGENHIAGRNVGGDGEVEFLAVGRTPAVTVRTISFEGGGYLEGLAAIDGEADLTGSAVVVAAAGQAVRIQSVFPHACCDSGVECVVGPLT